MVLTLFKISGFTVCFLKNMCGGNKHLRLKGGGLFTATKGDIKLPGAIGSKQPLETAFIEKNQLRGPINLRAVMPRLINACTLVVIALTQHKRELLLLQK
jgi:hypothetical protein